ncbi:PAS domain-containing sensor histidine kinase [Flavobacterium sp. J372]|uniref:PAS domain-containing sensor histidine kinase n=1 Tax=Flavobacterium sp. J372 TaxID=2898436 RepID=UPI002151B3C9|nr:PAS domain-containing sensor histidine kinase [Flavobacterium sp. J372]MCR5863166.1 PAS domain-containing sensor histidine kinase [Flavobacterium sp. J372]
MKFVESPDFHEGENLSDFYKKLLDQVPDLIFKLDYHGDNIYTITYCSENVNELFELTTTQFKKDTLIFFDNRIMLQDRAGFIESLEYAAHNLEPWKHEFRLTLPVKGLRWMRINAKPEKQPDGVISFYGRASDITDQKEQELKLQISEERYEFALKAASEGVWDWDIAANTVYLSGQSMKILGMEEKAVTMLLEEWRSRIHPDDLKGQEKAQKISLKNTNISYESIYRVKTVDGTYRWLLSRGRVVHFDAKGKPVRAMGVHKDITQLKEKEMELASTIDIVGTQNNKLSNFAHIVSHNLRSHAGNLRMLLDLFKAAPPEQRDEMMQHLEAISDGLNITIGHLKELVEIQSEIKLEKQPLNLRHYLKNILNILHNEITKHGVNVDINIPLDATVNYNPAYLESILLNFTTNAIKYSSPDRKPMLTYDFSIVDGKKILAVSDNGLGIDLRRHKNSLFGMYKTFHKNQNSRGIGLFITKNQVEAMGGRIEVNSEVNKGTTFKIYFEDEA